jgi:hypothetical protein
MSRDVNQPIDLGQDHLRNFMSEGQVMGKPVSTMNRPAMNILYQKGTPPNQMLRDRMQGGGRNNTNSDPDQ